MEGTEDNRRDEGSAPIRRDEWQEGAPEQELLKGKGRGEGKGGSGGEGWGMVLPLLVQLASHLSKII